MFYCKRFIIQIKLREHSTITVWNIFIQTSGIPGSISAALMQLRMTRGALKRKQQQKPQQENIFEVVFTGHCSLFIPLTDFSWCCCSVELHIAVLWVQVLVKVMRPRAVFAESISNSLIKSMHMRMGRPGLPVQPDGNVSQYQRFAPKQLKWTHNVLCFLTTLIEVPEF